MQQFTVHTRGPRQVVDITERIDATAAGDGLACISVPHCTCALYVNENEEGLVADTLQAVERLAGGQWRHDRIDNNAAAHIGASILGNSVCLPVQAGRLVLGTWQRVMLAELDGPRQRTVQVTLISGAQQMVAVAPVILPDPPAPQRPVGF